MGKKAATKRRPAPRKTKRPDPNPNDAAKDKLEETLSAKGWMVAFFQVDGDRIKLSRHSHQFPIGDFETALDLLEGNLRQAAVTDSIGR